MAYNQWARKGKVGSMGIALGCLSILIHWYAPSSLIEELYSKGLFPLVRAVFDHTIALSPIPFFYLLVAGVIYLIYRGFFNLIRVWRDGWSHVFLFFVHIFNLLGWIIFAFYWLWGFNYDRIQLADRINWDSPSFSPEDFDNESSEVLQRLESLRLTDSILINDFLTNLNYDTIEWELRKETSKVARALGYQGSDNLTCRQLSPSGILLRFSTAGFYNPFTGECNIDRGLHTLQKPFVMAHEFFHGLGVSGEGDCNFLAYITCFQSANPVIRYSGELGYWRYLRGGYRRSNPALYRSKMEMLPSSVIMDLAEIDAAIRKYPDIAPRMRDAMYNAYLRSNKIEDGMANYHQIVTLVIEWRKNPSLIRD